MPKVTAVYPLPKNTKMSVIVPALNEEKFIDQTLRNVQTVVPNAELLVVDGGSEDKTVDIARKYARVYFVNGTISAARNTGAKASEGDIIVFLDADTSINRYFIEEAMIAFRDPKVVGIGGLIMPHRKRSLVEILFYFLNFLIMVSFALTRPILAGTCVVYKKKPFLEVGGFDANMAASEDFDLCKRISRKGKVKFLRHAIVRTSRRRLEKLGLGGLLSDWLLVTFEYFTGKKSKNYRTFR